MSNKPIIRQTTMYNGLPLSPTNKGNEGFYQDILDAINRKMESSLNEHSKVLFMLFTFSYPSNHHSNAKDNILLPEAVISQGNEIFTYFLNQYVRRLNIQGYDVRYVWGREQTDTCDHCHYHLALWMNGNEIQYFGSLDEINGYWSQALSRYGIVPSGADTSGLIDRGRYEQYGKVQSFGMIVHRGNQDEYAEVYSRASYIAKVYSKNTVPLARTRSWGCSER